jgi:uncharacterized protein
MLSTEEPIQSPCIRNCCLNDDDICLGCFRSLEEIVGWADFKNSIRQTVLQKTVCRRAAYMEKLKAFSG